MKPKLILSSFLAAFALLLVSKMALAQSPSARPRIAAAQTARMTTIKTRSDNQVNARLNSLNAALSAITGAKKLSATDKASFTAQIQTDITSLTNLKTKIDADTDLTTLVADAKTIFTDFRIYAVFLPQVHLLSAADVMGVTADNLTAISSKLATRIQVMEAAGTNVIPLQTMLTDMNAKISDAQAQYLSVETEIIPLTPANYPATTTLKDARAKIKAGAADLKAAVADAKAIAAGIKGQ